MINKIILASRSGVRKKILNQNGINCEVIPANVDEDQIKESLLEEKASPELISKNLAELKANKVSEKKNDYLVLGADSVVDLNGELKCSDFLSIANITKKQLLPDDNLKLFRGYDGKYIKAQIAYLYLLFEYEMIDKAGEYLQEHDADEFIRFRALYDLKKEHNKYKITDLINIKHICNDA